MTLQFYNSSVDSQMMETQHYQYLPLSSQTVVRFLRLHPSINQFKDISIEVFEASLDTALEYEAISYTWDQQQPTHKIYCAGKKLSVTHNVDLILHRLRKKDAVRVLWIDSICIDQSSSSEKEVQIPRMGEIYSEARRVLVWLGDGTIHADAILKDLQGAGKYNFFDDTAISKNGQRYDSLITKTNIIRLILDLPWFYRLWTVQEVTVAKEVIFVYGNSLVAWEDFEWMVGFLSIREAILFIGPTKQTTLPRREDCYTKLKMLLFDANGMKVSEPPLEPLTTVLKVARTKNASEPRDKVYAVYGIFRFLGIHTIPEVNYSDSVDTIYFDITKAAIRLDNSLAILKETGLRRNFPDLPSWVPDWSNRSIHCAPSGKRRLGEVVYEVEGRQLKILGTITDFIKQVAPSTSRSELPERIHAPEERHQTAKKFIQKLQKWFVLCKEFDQYPTGHHTEDVFCITICQSGNAWAKANDPVDNDDYDPFPCGEFLKYLTSNFPETNFTMNDADEYITSLLIDAKNDEDWNIYSRNSSMKTLHDQFQSRMGCGSSFENWDDELKILFLLRNASKSSAQILELVEASVSQMTMFTTRGGYVGLASRRIQPDDCIALISGMDAPVVLRKDGDCHRIFGTAHILGYMEGEHWPVDKSKLRTITLV